MKNNILLCLAIIVVFQNCWTNSQERQKPSNDQTNAAIVKTALNTFRELKEKELRQFIPVLIDNLKLQGNSPQNIFHRQVCYECLLELTGRWIQYNPVDKFDLRTAQASNWQKWWQEPSIFWDEKLRVFTQGKPFQPNYSKETLYSFDLGKSYPLAAIQRISSLTGQTILYHGDPTACRFPLLFQQKSFQEILELIAWRNGCEVLWADIPILRPRLGTIRWWKNPPEVPTISLTVKDMPAYQVYQGITNMSGDNVTVEESLRQIRVTLEIDNKTSYSAMERVAEAINACVVWHGIPVVIPKSAYLRHYGQK